MAARSRFRLARIRALVWHAAGDKHRRNLPSLIGHDFAIRTKFHSSHRPPSPLKNGWEKKGGDTTPPRFPNSPARTLEIPSELCIMGNRVAAGTGKIHCCVLHRRNRVARFHTTWIHRAKFFCIASLFTFQLLFIIMTIRSECFLASNMERTSPFPALAPYPQRIHNQKHNGLLPQAFFPQLFTTNYQLDVASTPPCKLAITVVVSFLRGCKTCGHAARDWF